MAVRRRSRGRVLVVGSGISGLTAARRCADDGYEVDVIDKRNHIGGNCYDFTEPTTNIRVSKYGAHIFHTNKKRVWKFATKYGEWRRWEHRVIAETTGGLHVPVPVNITTMCAVGETHIATKEEAEEWMRSQLLHDFPTPRNSEELCLARFGAPLYDSLFKTYTVKQWGKFPSELSPEVCGRIPVRYNWDPRYFSCKYQALPADGYTAWMTNIASSPLIRIHLSTDYFDDKGNVATQFSPRGYNFTIYTGPVDTFFAGRHGLPALEYRSLRFTSEIHRGAQGFVLPNAVVNYCTHRVPFTRSVEYKQFLNQPSKDSIVVHETSQEGGEPFYPVLTPRNLALFHQYKELSDEQAQANRTYFVGRLATFKYLNMDAAMDASLLLCDTLGVAREDP